MKYNRKMVLISFEKFQELKRKSEARSSQERPNINTSGGSAEKRADTRTSSEEGDQQSRVDKSIKTLKGGNEIEEAVSGGSDSAAETLSLPTPPAQFVKSFFNETDKEPLRFKNRNKGKYTAHKKWVKLK